MQYHNLSLEAVFKELKSSAEGLRSDEAAARLKFYGPNELKEGKKTTKLEIFINQFKDFVILILIAAAIISLLVGEILDGVVIIIILALNAVIGFMQEYNAEESIKALRKLAGLRARVVRNGSIEHIDAALLVPGDVIQLVTGDKISADCRLVEAVNLQMQEAALTGESTPVDKEICVVKSPTLGDQRNMVFSGTVITRGRAVAMVTATGMATEIGKIAHLIQSTEDELTPLQKKIKDFGKFLGVGVLFICAVVFVLGLARGGDVFEMFLAAISLAVAAVPEGLPAVVTISLALGVQRMVRKNALVRKLPSVETLGTTTVICTDKTGTLTSNEMTVRRIYAHGSIMNVTGEGYSPKGTIKGEQQDYSLLMRIGALCNDTKANGEKFDGDPTEIALIVSAMKGGLTKERLDAKYPRSGEIPFDSDRKLMTTIHRIDGQRVAYTKGAVDVMLKLCNRLYIGGKVVKLLPAEKLRILKVNEQFALDALRVLAFAFKPVDAKQASEKDMIFVGLQAMMDPPRPEVRDAIINCTNAGIRVVMITGDHKTTAMAVAKELGITGEAITGEELEKIKDLASVVEKIGIYARVSPEHKLRIVEALKSRSHIVAMTGDGVNDAPALKRSDIGVSMGITGTDVAKEASDMILTDDNFSSIANAVREGRAIYDNIRKFIFYLLSSNLSEVMIIFFAMLIGLPLPLAAIQILWVNLVTDGMPALALSMEPTDKDIMLRKPRKPNDGIISRALAVRMTLIAAVICIGTLFLFSRYLDDMPRALTVAFTTLVMFEIFNAFNAREESRSILGRNLFSNKYMLAAVFASLLLHLAVIYTPLSHAFKTVPLGIADWIAVIGVASTVIIADEIFKLVQRHRAAA